MPEFEKDFQLLHRSLSGEPVLCNPDFSQLFNLATDASQTGIRDVLSQGKGDLYRLILFISRKLTRAECTYSMVGKEALVVKWAVGNLHYYLLHNTFSLWVDHESLQWLESMKD